MLLDVKYSFLVENVSTSETHYTPQFQGEKHDKPKILELRCDEKDTRFRKVAGSSGTIGEESTKVPGVIEAIGPEIVLFAPHHGRDSGRVPATWLERIKPKLIVVGEAPSKDLHYYPEYNTITQNSAGDITFDCETGKVHIYVSDAYYEVGFLADEQKVNSYGHYIGTIAV